MNKTEPKLIKSIEDNIQNIHLDTVHTEMHTTVTRNEEDYTEINSFSERQDTGNQGKLEPEYIVALRLTLGGEHRSISLNQVLYASALVATSRSK